MTTKEIKVQQRNLKTLKKNVRNLRHEKKTMARILTKSEKLHTEWLALQEV